MNRRNVIIGVAGLLTVPAIVWAHEGHAHKVMGTVVGYDAAKKQLEVKSREGASVVFALGSAKIVKGAAAATVEELTAGARVVVSYKEQAGVKSATEVRLAGEAAK